MKYRTEAVGFALLVAWCSTAGAALTVDFTVPLNISRLPEMVQWFKVECELLDSGGAVVGNADTNVMVDTSTGKPQQNEVTMRVLQYPNGNPPTNWKCTLYLSDNSSFLSWKTPSTQPNPAWRPAPGTPLVEEVSGALPAPEVPLRSAPR